ncbi:protein FAM200A-like [Artemia franciscana]|uniref:protein FAM200A-like n=1 Tax=Artemia franciscana TaxID=6661 RepID=UPI0032DB84E4
MTGQDLGFAAFVKAGNDHITFTHSMIHREALVVKKKIAPELNTVFFDAVKIINFIKRRALNSRLFKNLCIDMDSDYTSLLLHAEDRWLSRGRSLKRLLTLKDEVLIFLTEQNSNLADYFHDN